MTDTTPTMRAEFWVERQGRRFALFQGLLDYAHQKGLQGINTEVLQVGDDDNGQTWLVRAVVTMPSGTFSGLGDASPANVAPLMRTVLPRLAETRSVARALRFATNIGVAALEELGDDSDIVSAETVHYGGQPREVATPVAQARPPAQQQRSVQSNGPAQAPVAPVVSSLATQPQVRAIYSIGRDQRNMTEQEVDDHSRTLFNSMPAELTKKQASELIKTLQVQNR